MSERITRGGIAFGLTVALSVGAALAELSDHTSAAPVPAVEQCSAPSQQEIDAVASLLETPQPAIDDQFVGLSRKSKLFKDRLHAQEAKFGVTFAQPLRYTLNHSVLDPPSYPEIKRSTEYVLAQSGITLDAPLHPTIKETASNASQMNTDENISALAQIESLFENIPQNLIRKTDLKAVNFVHTGDFTGEADLSTGTMLVKDSGTNGNDGVMTHEFGHFLDQAECGSDGMSNDPAYANLNIAGSLAYDDAPQNDTPQKIHETNHIALNEVEDYVHTLNIFPYGCEYDEVLADAATGQQMATEYSYTSVAEDKAEIGRRLLNITYYKLYLNKNAPVIRAKFLLLMTRLRKLDPGTFDYLAMQYRMDTRRTHCDTPN